MQDQNFEVLVVDHTISGYTARELAEAFRAKNPNGKVIAITATPYLMIRSDKIVKATDGPEGLIEAIQELLEPPNRAVCG